MHSKQYQCQFFLTLTPDLKKYLRSKFKGHKVNISDEILSLEKLDPNTEVLGTFVDSQIDKKVFDRLKKLKLIITLSTGFDHIDLSAAKKKKVTVCNVPTYGENTVAEYTIGMMLALSRKFFQSVKRVKQEGIYDYHGLRGFDLAGKTIGVLGTGNIGQHVIKMLHGFDVNILAYDVFKNQKLIDDYGVKYVPLPTLFSQSDIITLHVPLLDSTRYIINKKSIKKMKKGVYIINTARGGLIDSEALLWGLKNEIVAGAGLDVLDNEDLLEDTLKLLRAKCDPLNTRKSLMNSLLIDHPNTIVTPHNAFNSNEAVKRIIDTSIQNFRQFALGKTQNKVNSV